MMVEMIQENWLLFVIALLIGIAVAYWIFVVTRRTSVTTTKIDALDEGAAPAARNQALIDTPPASATIPVVPPGLAGAGTAVAAVVEEQRAEALKTASDDADETGADDLSRIKGVGPKLEAMLIALGVTRFSQIAAWSDDGIDRIDAQLGRFEGRIRRDNWVAQAQFLQDGDMAGYEEKFGKL
ncbi:hypothetical protein [Allopontixanthobacter sp.]|uniref:hypothetical protein n=1 Tax=Allopontixanthobacter sp. TaxID=2906452 RepID=UPI002ABCCAB6|nr:hypothetical protein [Allopontixanthobacter sp.]MDZ4307068.1 hypothetical protein [Allopontixanthobacter sp.]